MEILDRIKLKCKEQNTSISRIEKELGFSERSINKWDKSVPSIDKVIAVANKLNISIAWLATGKEENELTERENILLKIYRCGNDQSQRTILNMAQMIIDQEEPTGESSNSKIG